MKRSVMACWCLIGWVACKSAAPESPKDPADRNLVALPEAAAAANPIRTEHARRTKLAPNLSVVGSVTFDPDHVALLGPLVEGRVVRLPVSVGARVNKREVLAEIESAEIGNAQGAYLSAKAKHAAAEQNLRREQDLNEKHISSQREREAAQAEATIASAELNAAKLRLLALGFEVTDLAQIERHEVGGRVPLRSPIAGVVVERYLTLGQAVERARDAFKIADTSKLWVQLDLFEKDLRFVHVGQNVELSTDALPGEKLHAKVAIIGAEIDTVTRTLPVRIEFDNPHGKLRPGLFVTARILSDQAHPENQVLTVPRKAIQSVEGKSLVFVRDGAGFRKQVVEVGFSDGVDVEVRSGLDEGHEVATDGAFLLKSELLR